MTISDDAGPRSGSAAGSDHDPAARQTARSERSVIAYLAFLSILLAFGIDAALPAFDEISAEFGLEQTGQSISLIGTLYFLGMAAGQLIYGPLADRFGRGPIIRLGLGFYTVGGIAAALAPNFELLLVARLIWGLGAAAPGVLRGAIARDLYSGDKMARVVTLMMAVFLVGPILAPFVGQGILTFAPWPWVFVASVVLAAIGLTWSFRFGETLDPANRRELDLGPILTAGRIVLRSRITVGHIAVQTLSGAAFFIYLGSSSPIITDIYGRGDQFALWFGVSGVVMVIGLLINNRLIERFGASTMILAAGGTLVVASAVGLVVTLAADGRPGFFVWLVWVCIVNALTTLVTPMANAIALDPMGELAGTASAILGFISLGGGALLAAVIDARIDTTVTPMLVGYVMFTSLAFVALVWARPGQPSLERSGTG